jgi:hypothetical protein
MRKAVRLFSSSLRTNGRRALLAIEQPHFSKEAGRFDLGKFQAARAGLLEHADRSADEHIQAVGQAVFFKNHRAGRILAALQPGEKLVDLFGRQAFEDLDLFDGLFEHDSPQSVTRILDFGC